MRRIETLQYRLLERRRALFRQVASVENDIRFLDSHVAPELEEESQEQILAGLLARLDERGAAEIARVDRALARMESGDYGVCEECEEPIPEDRLEALPTAVTCVSCAEARERAAVRMAAAREAERA
jgi:DnaK suppressor protein